LNNSGILVKTGFLNNQIKNFYRSYIKSKKDRLPFVTSKIAISKDFFTINKKKEWITNKYSRGRVHLMRSNHDCIITSSSTIIKDNPSLTCRIEGLNKSSPSRIILDNNLKIPLKSKILKDANIHKTIIFHSLIDKKKLKSLRKLKIITQKMPININGKLDLRRCLLKAKQLGFSRIFLESGLKLNRSFLIENLIDDFIIFKSDRNLGKYGEANIKNDLKSFLMNKNKQIEKVNLFGNKLFSYQLK